MSKKLLFYGASFLWKYQDNSLPYYIFLIFNHPVYQLTPKYFLMIPEHCVDLSSQLKQIWNEILAHPSVCYVSLVKLLFKL